MATTVDRYIEQFDLIDRYSAKMDAMSRQTDRFAQKVERAHRIAMKFALGVAGALAAGLVALGTDAVKAAANFEQFAVTLEVLTGSADKAQKKLDFIKQLAIPSTFTFAELAEAGTQLESFRVPLEKALPLIAKLGAAFPKKNLEDFVNLFGRLGSGDFPDIEALSGAGLSKLDFMQKGIKFDSQGSLLSSSRETMDALEQIINDRYGKILDRIANTTNAKLATVRDKWEQILRKVGDAILKYGLPALDKLTAALDKLNESKGFDTFLKKIGKFAVVMTGLAFGVVATWLGALALIQLALGNFIGAAILAAGSFAVALTGVWATGKVGKFFKDLLKDGGAGGGGSAAVPPTPPGLEFPDNPALKSLNNIERHTRETSDHTRQALDLRKFALGGGEIGAMGITPIERYGGRGRGGAREIRVDVSGARDQLSQAMQTISMNVLNQAVRQGLIGGGR